LFWRVPVTTEVNEELEAHIELQTQRFIREGMTPEAARARAMSRFGDRNSVSAECTDIRQHMEDDMRRSEFFEELRQDAVFAIRGFRRAPLFTLVALLTIAIGIGTNTAIFSVVNTVLLRPLPYPNADRGIVIFNDYGTAGLERAAISGGELFDYRETMKSLDEIAAIRPGPPATLLVPGSEPEPIVAYTATPNLFEVLGVRPILGRGFLPTDGRPNETPVAVLSHALWLRRFGGDSGIIGKQVVLNAVPRTVVGVMAEGMRFPDGPVGYAKAKAEMWVANTLETTRTPNQRGNQNLIVIGRMGPGTTRAMVARDLAAVDARFKREDSTRYNSPAVRDWKTIGIPLREEMVGAVRPALLMLTGAVALVLLIACVNVANLLLARTALRQRELAVRLALGADRSRLLRQLITESTMLALLGGTLGIGVAWLAVRGLRTYAVVEMPQLSGISLDPVVLAYCLVISLIAGVLIGLVPAFQQSSAQAGSVLGESARGSSSGTSRRRLRSALVVAQVAMALIVLNTAGLLGRSFAAMQRVEPGFVADGVMSTYLNLPRRAGGAYDSLHKVNAFYERLQRDLAALPGVSSVGAIYPLPVSGDAWSGSFDVEGWPENSPQGPHAEYAVAMPGYFRTMGIRLRGRDFTADDRLDRPQTVIIDEELAKKYWPNQDAIGKRISRDADEYEWMTVVGVVNHVRRDGPTEAGEPQIYLPYLQHPQGMLYTVVKTASGEPYTLTTPIRQAVRNIDRELPVSKQRSLADLQHDAIARQRFNLVLTGLFAIAALALASIGLYGVMAYLVAQRTREIGIRVALGGQPSDVRGMVFKESLGIAIVGLVIGTLGSLAISRGLTGFLFEISATDPITYVAIAALLLAVAGMAAFGPARRATRVDPLIALRE
jgi:putative ABC transport system permease protein